MNNERIWHIRASIRLIQILCLFTCCGTEKTKGPGVDSSTGSDLPAYTDSIDLANAGPDAILGGEEVLSRLDAVPASGGDLAPDDGPATYLQTDAFTGWVGGACGVNADCLNSPAAKGVSAAKCLTELFCLDGICHGDCTNTCVVVRSDTNPCLAPRLCVTFAVGGGISLCEIAPVQCSSVGDCPFVRPLLPDGGQADWTCESGVCRYPGFQYATQ
jgi:hypothetical protein